MDKYLVNFLFILVIIIAIFIFLIPHQESIREATSEALQALLKFLEAYKNDPEPLPA